MTTATLIMITMTMMLTMTVVEKTNVTLPPFPVLVSRLSPVTHHSHRYRHHYYCHHRLSEQTRYSFTG